MKTRALALALSVFGLSLSALADDSQILSEIHHTNQKEIAAAQLATERSVNSAVVDYGQRLIRDHTNADQRTVALAKEENIPIQQLPTTADESAQKKKLSGLSADAFDREFVQMMAQGHKDVIAKLTSAQHTASDPRVKNLIVSLLPTLQHHYSIAMDLENRVTGVG